MLPSVLRNCWPWPETNWSNFDPSCPTPSEAFLASASITFRLSPYCLVVILPAASSLFSSPTFWSSCVVMALFFAISSESNFCAAFASVSSDANRACSSAYCCCVTSPLARAAFNACVCAALPSMAASTFCMAPDNCSCRLASSPMMPLCCRAMVVASAILSRKRRPCSVRPERLLLSSRACAERARSVSTASLNVLLSSARRALFRARAAVCSAVACPVCAMALLIACSSATRLRVSLFISRIAPLVSSRRLLMSSKARRAGPCTILIS